jgi:hypothetical protein
MSKKHKTVAEILTSLLYSKQMKREWPELSKDELTDVVQHVLSTRPESNLCLEQIAEMIEAELVQRAKQDHTDTDEAHPALDGAILA